MKGTVTLALAERVLTNAFAGGNEYIGPRNTRKDTEIFLLFSVLFRVFRGQ